CASVTEANSLAASGFRSSNFRVASARTTLTSRGAETAAVSKTEFCSRNFLMAAIASLLSGVGKSVLPNIDCRSAFLSGMEQPLCQGRLPEYGDDQLHRRLSYRTSSLDQKHSHRRFTIFSYSNHITSSLSAIQDQCGSGGSGSAA